ncbi:3-ketoacyl-CoA synthase 6 [Tanacetum coccineum]
MLSFTFPALGLNHVKLAYRCLIDHILPVIIPIVAITAACLLHPSLIKLLWSFFTCIFIFIVYFISKPNTIYLVDYICYNPPKALRSPFSFFMESSKIYLKNNPKSVEFQMRILERSGLSEETCVAPGFHYMPPKTTIEDSIVETELVIFSIVDSLFKKTNLKPKDVDILIVNCSVFSPVPSLVSMVMNKYKMRSNVKCYNLSGMGCSAGLIAIDLARSLLINNPNSNAVVISTEIISPNYYEGNDRSMLLPNCLFRLGGAAIFLSNKWHEHHYAKYKLINIVRTHTGSHEESYKSIHQIEDHDGKLGVRLSKNLSVIAGRALKTNIMKIGPAVLPVSEQLLYVLNLIGTKIFKQKWKPYVPDFTQAFEHFCIHAGGRAVINEMQKNLGLSDEHIEPSRMTLHRFGNTSSSSLWYELSYLESKGRMKKGDRVWQIALGSGFKCNSAVWRCNRSVKTPVAGGPWEDCIDHYPVNIPEVVKL